MFFSSFSSLVTIPGSPCSRFVWICSAAWPSLAHPAPTFAMVPVYARANGLTPVGVPLTGDDYAVDADALLATNACVIYLCTPNNPTATPMAREAVLRVVERAPGLVIIENGFTGFFFFGAREFERRRERFPFEFHFFGCFAEFRTTAGLVFAARFGRALAVVRQVFERERAARRNGEHRTDRDEAQAHNACAFHLVVTAPLSLEG